MFVREWRCFIRIVRLYLRYCIIALNILFCYGICDSIIYIISVYFVNDGKLHHLMCVNTHSLNWIHFPLWALIDLFVWIGIVHGILFDMSGWYHCIWCEYSTPARWSGVMLAHTTRITWCCPFSYFISEFRRGGLWACPQPSSYSWWGCEYNMYRLLTKLYLQFLGGEVHVCELYYWLARVFSRASRRCSSYNLFFGSLTWLTYALWDVLSRWHRFWRVWLLQCACHFFGIGTSTHVCSQSIPDCYIIKWHVSHAWYVCWTIKALVEAEMLYDGFTVSHRCIVVPLIIARPLGVLLLMSIIRLA